MPKKLASFQPDLDKLPPQFASIEDLLAACLKGDDRAWQVFRDLFHAKICAGVRARVGRVRPEWACLVEERDLTGMLYCELRRGNFSALRRLITRSKIVNYFVSVLSHDIIDALRRLERQEIVAHDLLCQIQPPDRPDEVAMQFEKLDLINKALSKLSSQDQAMVNMRYFAGMKYREIAAELGMEVNCVGVKCNRLKHKLRQMLLLGELRELE